MKTFLKILLYILVWSLIGVLVIGATILLGDTFELGLKIFIGLFLLWLLYLLVRRIIVRWRAKKRVQSLINEEAPEPEAGEEKKGFWRSLFPQRSGFQGRFKKIIRILRESRLRSQGDALYVLPWYLVMDPGDSRSDLLERADLASPTINDPALSSDGTSFDWFLYNQAVSIEVPACHIRNPGNREKSEWRHLLQGLIQYRRREPLNGVVITVAARHLLDTEPGLLAEQGHEVRARIDEIMNGLKLRLPVYLMISGIEDIPEMSAWVQTLDPGRLNEAMGLAAAEDSTEAGPIFVQRALRKVADRLKDLVLVNLTDDPGASDLMALPGVIESLSEPLTAFAGRAFETNPYQESPMLRGVYFGGAQARSSTDPEVETLWSGLFLRDFFTNVVPADRRLISTLTSAERAERTARRFVLSGWSIIVILAFAALLWAYFGNAGFIGQQSERFAGQFSERARFQENVDAMADMREMVITTDETVATWLVPWFDFESPPGFVAQMRELYVERTERRLLEPAALALDARVKGGAKEASAGEGASYDKVSTLLWSLVNRINLLTAYLEGASQEELLALPSAFDMLDEIFTGGAGDALIGRMDENYIQYLFWKDDDVAVREEMDEARRQLLTILRTQLTGLDWLIPWANEQLPGRGVKLADYWDGTGTLPGEIRIAPAFTLAGKEAIDTFLERLSATDPESEELQRMREKFDALYRKQYLGAWSDFGLKFNVGRQSLRGRSEYADAIDALGGPRNPFIRWLTDAAEQIKPFVEQENAVNPEWATLVTYFQTVRLYGADDGVDNKKRNKTLAKMGIKALKVLGPVGKALGGAAKKGLKTQKKLAGKGGAELDAVLEQSSEAYQEYRKALLDVAFNADIKSVSFKAASALFSDPDNPGAGDGPEARAWNAVRKLQTLIGKPNKYNGAFWEVYSGALEVITDYEVSEAACYLQERWRDGLLVELEGVPDYKKPELMFGEGGKVWLFMDGDGKPFIKRAYGKGYVPVKAAGRSLDIKKDFLNFVARGRDGYQVRQDSYDVSFKAFPTTAEPLSAPQPSMTTLTLECPEAFQELVNQNFATDKTFTWKETCGDVRMEIEVDGRRYTKSWTGPKAFPSFLNDFRDGAKRFTPSDFGAAGKSLADAGVLGIQLDYEIKGHAPVIGALRQVPTKAPAQIAGCWEGRP
ncbi:MAG: type VI secretion protein IcmF/TssM N-terminal domain-containing protein [Gammaproteobacteria bacterium]